MAEICGTKSIPRSAGEKMAQFNAVQVFIFLFSRDFHSHFLSSIQTHRCFENAVFFTLNDFLSREHGNHHGIKAF